MTAKEIDLTPLLNTGWHLGDPDEHAHQHLHCDHPAWDALTWAHRTALRARYGFSTHGRLSLTPSQLRNPLVSEPLRLARPGPDGWARPKGALPGLEDRLQKLLETERVHLDGVDFDITGLLHDGPDGSQIFTTSDFWGPLDDGHPEVKELDMAPWDDVSYGVSQAPDWAMATSY